jgi:flagella basal body P-ring formation protein FlgA
MVLTQKNLLTFIVLLIGIVCPAYSDEVQSLEAIEHEAYVFSLAEAQAQFDHPQVMVEQLDSRLRLQSCNTDLVAFSTTPEVGAGNQTIGVKCNSPVAWTVYVPVKIKVMMPVVVATRGLSAKHIITPDDVRVETQDIASMRKGYIENPEQVIGHQLRYPVALGSVMNPTNLIAQKVVRRGEQIMLVAGIGGMEVRMAGTALSDAQFGQRIRVKNVSSKRIVEGVVDGPGVVRVTM